MSIQAGVLYFDRRPIASSLLASIGRYLDPFGPDGGGQHVGAGFGMVYRALHVTPEDHVERQPLVSKRGCVMTWDGRLDNRADLRRQLWRDLGDETTDGAIALAAYERWGDDCFRALIGDWSIALIQADNLVLRLASDYTANRALYYSLTDCEVHWSTSLAELVDRLGWTEYDPRFMVGFLSGSPPPETTPYRGVYAVAAAQLVTVGPAGLERRTRHWSVAPDTIRYRDPRDYQVALREAFAQAVQCRLRSSRPVWSDLSGGLDSSSVVCMADRIIGEDSRAAALSTISYITDGSPESDERRFIAIVEEFRGKAGLRVNGDACADIADEEWGWATPLHPSGIRLEIMRQVVQHRGRVLMTGKPGDLIMLNAPEDLGCIVDAVVRRDFRQTLRYARQWARAAQQPIWAMLLPVLRLLGRRGRVEELLLSRLRRSHMNTRNLQHLAARAFHFTDQAARIWHDEAVRQAERISEIGVTQLGLFTMLTGIQQLTSERINYTPAECGLVYTHPFMHRPLVSFLLSIPIDVIYQPGRPRLLMKQAFADILPMRIAARFSKGHFSPFSVRRLKASLPLDLGRLDQFRVVQLCYIDREALRASACAVRSGIVQDTLNIETVLELERWLNWPRPSASDHSRSTHYSATSQPLASTVAVGGPAKPIDT